MINWSPGVTLDQMEEQVIRKAFAHYRGNKTVTANALGISIRTLDGRLEKYEAENKKKAEDEELAQKNREAFLLRSRGFATTHGVQIVEIPQQKVEYKFEDSIETTSFKSSKRGR